jgi:hypothetical protein
MIAGPSDAFTRPRLLFEELHRQPRNLGKLAPIEGDDRLSTGHGRGPNDQVVGRYLIPLAPKRGPQLGVDSGDAKVEVIRGEGREDLLDIRGPAQASGGRVGAMDAPSAAHQSF